jgi:hypothetical protein
VSERDLRFGTTCQAHVDGLLERAGTALAHVAANVYLRPRRLKPTEREALSRQLAGVIAECESIRIWLGAGAPK